MAALSASPAAPFTKKVVEELKSTPQLTAQERRPRKQRPYDKQQHRATSQHAT